MGGGGFNLAFLRANNRVDGSVAPESGGRGISRRQLFQLAGAVTVATAVVQPGKAMALPGTMEFVAGSDRAAFRLDGLDRWVIDTRRFGGNPILRVEQSPARIFVELTRATYPGTDLPADMTGEARLDNNLWTLHLSGALGAFRVSVPLHGWLLGDVPARARVLLNNLVCPLGDGAGLSLSGTARAQFDPDWTFRLEGSAIARADGLGRAPLLSDSADVALTGPGDASLLNSPPDRRTRITLLRHDRTWDLDPASATPSGWDIQATDHLFDVLHIETGLTRKEIVRRVLVAEPRTPASRMAVGLGALRMPLDSVRYAAGFDQTGTQTALVGRFSANPDWLHAQGCSLLLGDAKGAQPGFELHTRDGSLTRATCSPAVLGLATPMRGALVQPELHTGGADLRAHLASTIQERPSISEEPIRINPFPTLPIFEVPLTFSLSVIRPEDLLVLRFEFINFTLQVGGDKPARLAKAVNNRPAYVLVHFQPQSIGEQAFYETEVASNPANETPPAPPVHSRLAGGSRLAFLVPAGVTEIPYTLESLLDWRLFETSVAPNAAPPPLLLPIHLKPQRITDDEEDCDCEPLIPSLIRPPRVETPQAYHSAIEAPYRVIISPNKYAGWAHSLSPVTHAGRTELWHTRLGVRTTDAGVDEASTYYRTVRAIWSPDFRAAEPPVAVEDTSPFRMSLSSNFRNQIVRLSSDFTIPFFRPRPVQAERLMLSSMGAWLNVSLTLDPPAPFTVEEWRHRAVMGRDTYVRVVEKGYLFPWGHRASLITVTERKFQPTPMGTIAAYLRQRKFIVVRQPEKTYPGSRQAYAGRQMPFKKVRIATLVTPSIDPPVPIVPASGESSFWIRVSSKDFLFNVVTQDSDGQRQEFSMPLIFIRNDIAGDAAKMGYVAAHYAAPPQASRRNSQLHAQKLAYAPSDKPGDTSFETVAITFGGEVPDAALSLPANQPRFYPAMAGAQVRLSAVERMAGAPAPATIRLNQTYLQSGFDPGINKSAVFADLADAVALRFPANMSGGVATPNMDISGFSRALGPVGGAVGDIIGGTFDPKKFFSDEAKILGGILLSDILQLVGLSGDTASKDERVPHLTSRVVYPEVGGKEDTDAVPLGIETKLIWKPPVKNDPLNIFVTNPNTTLTVVARMFADFAGNPPEFTVRGELKNFKVDLLAPVTSFLILTFKQITFTAKSGEKPDVVPQIDTVEFAGPLKFVQTLQSFLGSGGGGNSPFGLDVTPSGVNANFSLAIPSVQVGVLSIQNIKFSAGLNLPFNGDPVRLRFGFCERQNPFLLTVSMFGGGGFFAIALGIDGIESLEAGFEFGGNLSLNIGVASGGVYVMAGIYYKMQGESAALTGYLRCGGSLEVLGIITISVEFYMGLTYDIPKDKVWGQASLTVKVEVLFFSVSVSLSVERKFKGSAGDPTFADLVDRTDWESYCEAFA